MENPKKGAAEKGERRKETQKSWEEKKGAGPFG